MHAWAISKFGFNHPIKWEDIWGFPKIRGTLFGSPYNKDYSIGVYIGVPLIRETTIETRSV